MGKSHATRWASDSPTPAQLKEFFAQIESGKITGPNLQDFLRGKNGKEESTNHFELLREQERFYKEVWGVGLDLSHEKIPDLSAGVEEGFGWILYMMEGRTTYKIWDKLSERIKTYKYIGNLESITSDRDPQNGGYIIRLRDRVEADEELKNKSADDLKHEGISGITLPERLQLELFYHWKTGGHLDLENVTLCSGSRSLDGSVPRVHWYGDRLDLDWYDAHRRGDYLRSRLAVS